jgi:putative endonuclease
MSTEELLVYQLAAAAQRQAIRKRRRQRRRSASLDPARADRPSENLSPSQYQGRIAENLAQRHLESAGLIVLARNLRSKTGELDLVCNDHGILAFVEVRRRESSRYGGAAASVNLAKQERLIKTARYFLPRLTRQFFRGVTPCCRFDVVAIGPEGLAWFRHAFTERQPRYVR